jgi:hypothetical protein
MDINKAQLIEAANAAFAKWQVPLHEDEQGHFLGTLVGEESALVDLIVDCQGEPLRIHVAGLLSFRIPLGRLDAISRFLDLVHPRITLRSFHLIHDIRMVACGLGTNVPDGASVEQNLIASLGLVFAGADRWTPKVAGVAMSNDTPVVAAERAFVSTEFRQPEWSEIAETNSAFN